MDKLFTKDFYKFLFGFFLIITFVLLAVAGVQMHKKTDGEVEPQPSVTPKSTTTQAF